MCGNFVCLFLYHWARVAWRGCTWYKRCNFFFSWRITVQSVPWWSVFDNLFWMGNQRCEPFIATALYKKQGNSLNASKYTRYFSDQTLVQLNGRPSDWSKPHYRHVFAPPLVRCCSNFYQRMFPFAGLFTRTDRGYHTHLTVPATT